MNMLWLIWTMIRKGRRDGAPVWFSPRTGGWDVVAV